MNGSARASGLLALERKTPRDPFAKRGQETGMKRRQMALPLHSATDGEAVISPRVHHRDSGASDIVIAMPIVRYSLP